MYVVVHVIAYWDYCSILRSQGPREVQALWKGFSDDSTLDQDRTLLQIVAARSRLIETLALLCELCSTEEAEWLRDLAFECSMMAKVFANLTTLPS
jgi:hypothetical protein